MKKEIIGGFVVKELPAKKKNRDNEIAKCWHCGRYGTRSEMNVVNKMYNCDTCYNKLINEGEI